MFQINRQIDYALLFMVALAERYNQGYTSLRLLARERKLPYRFLAKITISLRKENLIVAQEGVNGGYRLVNSPERIFLKKIFEALGGNLSLVRCNHDEASCPSFCQCSSKRFWRELQEAINQIASKYSLADLVGHSPGVNLPNVKSFGVKKVRIFKSKF